MVLVKICNFSLFVFGQNKTRNIVNNVLDKKEILYDY